MMQLEQQESSVLILSSISSSEKSQNIPLSRVGECGAIIVIFTTPLTCSISTTGEGMLSYHLSRCGNLMFLELFLRDWKVEFLHAS